MDTDVLLGLGIAVFAIIRCFVEPRLRYWAKTSKGGLNPRLTVIVALSVSRFLGNFFGLMAVGAIVGKALTYWVESVDVTALSARQHHPLLIPSKLSWNSFRSLRVFCQRSDWQRLLHP